MKTVSVKVLILQMAEFIDELEPKKFWKFMNGQRWLLPFLENGQATNELGSIGTLDTKSFWQYVNSHRFCLQILNEAEKSKRPLLWRECEKVLPAGFDEEVIKPGLFFRAYHFLQWIKTAELFANLRIIIDQPTIRKARVSQFMPPELHWFDYRRCEDKKLKRLVWQEYVLHFMYLVKSIAWTLSLNYPPSVELPDLISDGVSGLIQALERFDPLQKVRFATYATPRIRGAILDSLREYDWAPRTVRARERKLEAMRIRLQHKFGCNPTYDQLAEELGISYAELVKSLEDSQQAMVQSLDELVYHEEDDRPMSRIELIPDQNHSAIDILEGNELIDYLPVAINTLSIQQAMIVRMYYYGIKTLKEIGSDMRISESRVSQVHTKAIFNLQIIFHRRFGVPLLKQISPEGRPEFGRAPFPAQKVRQALFEKEKKR
jgi:RNA polymerase sigma factor for flagellar operon FliA